MNEFLNSLKADLLDRRLLPLVALAAALLAGALAYAVLGGGSSSRRRGVLDGRAGVEHGHRPAIAVSPSSDGTATARSPRRPSGARTSSQGASRNPFTAAARRGQRQPSAATSPAPRSGTRAPARKLQLVLERRVERELRSEQLRQAAAKRPRPKASPRRAKPSRRPSTDVAVLFGAAARRHAGRPRQPDPVREPQAASSRCRRHAAADRLPRRDRRRQERHVHARRRSDPARQRRLPAERLAVPGDRPQARPDRAARIPLARTAQRSSTNCGRRASTAEQGLGRGRAARRSRRRIEGRRRSCCADRPVGDSRPALLAAPRACSCSPRTPRFAARAHAAAERAAAQRLPRPANKLGA